MEDEHYLSGLTRIAHEAKMDFDDNPGECALLMTLLNALSQQRGSGNIFTIQENSLHLHESNCSSHKAGCRFFITSDTEESREEAHPMTSRIHRKPRDSRDK